MRKHILILLGIFLLIGGGVWLWISQPDEAQTSVADVMGARPNITAPRQQRWPTVKIADVVGWQNGAKPTPAAGLQVQAFAAKLDHPRWMYRLPNGDVLVAETNSPPREGGGIQGWIERNLMGRAGATVPSANRITLLRDADGDGVAEARSVLVQQGLNSPFGMALVGDHLYVANTDAVVRYPFKPGETRITAPAEHITKLPPGRHWTRNLLAAPDGSVLYIAVGSNSNIADQGMAAEKYRANILELNLRTRALRIYAAGLRNPVGMAFEPKSGRLWTVVNERDMLGSDLPPDYLTAVDLGDHFGWPWYYWGGYPDKRVEPGNPALQEYSKRPDYALGAHTASLGLSFAADAKLGGNFANGAFIGQHGSWNRVPPAGYKVIYVPFGDNGFPAKDAKPVDVLGGFLNAEGKAQGRPVGVITDRTGALLVADDVGNVIWRVSAAR